MFLIGFVSREKKVLTKSEWIAIQKFHENLIERVISLNLIHRRLESVHFFLLILSIPIHFATARFIKYSLIVLTLGVYKLSALGIC